MSRRWQAARQFTAARRSMTTRTLAGEDEADGVTPPAARRRRRRLAVRPQILMRAPVHRRGQRPSPAAWFRQAQRASYGPRKQAVRANAGPRLRAPLGQFVGSPAIGRIAALAHHQRLQPTMLRTMWCRNALALELEAPVGAAPHGACGAGSLPATGPPGIRVAERTEIVLTEQQAAVAARIASPPARNTQPLRDRPPHWGAPRFQQHVAGSGPAQLRVPRVGRRHHCAAMSGGRRFAPRTHENGFAADGGVEVDDLVERVHASRCGPRTWMGCRRKFAERGCLEPILHGAAIRAGSASPGRGPR